MFAQAGICRSDRSDRAAAFIVRINVVSNGLCPQIPCAAHSCTGTAGDVKAVGQYKPDASYQDIAAAGGVVCRDGDRLDTAHMFLSTAVSFSQDDTQCCASVRADIFDRHAKFYDASSRFKISVPEIYGQEIFASFCGEIDGNRTWLRCYDHSTVYRNGRIGEGDSVALCVRVCNRPIHFFWYRNPDRCV